MSSKPSEQPAQEPDTEPLDSPEAEQPEEPTPQELKAQLREAKAEAKAAQKLADERAATVKFWQEREKAGKPVPNSPKVQAAPEPDPLEEFDWVGVLTDEKDPGVIAKKVAKAVKAQVAAELKRGNYISRDESERYIAQIVEGATHINQLVADFPQLVDPKSEFFAETQQQLGRLAEDPAYKGAPDVFLQRMAAQQAEITLRRAGKLDKETDDDRYERIANQRGGSRGRGQPAGDDTVLSAAEKDMARKLGVPEKDYLAQKRAMQRPGALGPAMTADRMMREFGR